MFIKSRIRFGVEFPNAYWRIDRVTMFAWPELLMAHFHIYADQAAHENGQVPIDVKEVGVQLTDVLAAAPDTTESGLNTGLKAAVLALPEFADATVVG